MTTILDNEVSREVAKIVLKAKYPNLMMVGSDPKLDGLTTAAKNIRAELKAAYPAVKFSVKARRFAGGDAIDVGWTDGPTNKMVDTIVNKYKAGYFDGQDDSYNYSTSDWNRAFGDAKYISAGRDYSDDFIASAIDITSRKFGVLPITVDEYRKGGAWNWERSLDMGRELNIVLSKLCRAFPVETAA